jgi:uncharacterized protein YgiM (DUF1202 family)
MLTMINHSKKWKSYQLLLLMLVMVTCSIVQAQDKVTTDPSVSIDDKVLARVKVVEPFVEWRSGPAEGYPVFHVSEQGEWLGLLIRKTDWMKVNDEKGNEGWIRVSDLLKTYDSSGSLVSIVEPEFDDFSTRRWEAGLMHGEFDGAAVNAGYVGYWMTEHLSLELWGSQVLGDSSEILISNINLLHQPFPSWRFSPFFTIGAGQLFIDPKSTLAEAENRSEDIIHAGFGARYYIDNRYFIRMEVKDYKVFTNRETNEEATEWKIGLSVFF